MSISVIAQRKYDVYASVYSYADKTSPISTSPVLAFYRDEDVNCLWGEIRYNYDDVGVLGTYIGYHYIHETKNASLEIAPNVGFLTGSYSGISPGINIDFEQGHLVTSIQYFNPISFTKSKDDFSFLWAELVYKAFDDTTKDWNYSFGLSSQWLNSHTSKQLDYGIKANIEDSKWELFLYVFEFWDKPFINIGCTFHFQKSAKKYE